MKQSEKMLKSAQCLILENCHSNMYVCTVLFGLRRCNNWLIVLFDIFFFDIFVWFSKAFFFIVYFYKQVISIVHSRWLYKRVLRQYRPVLMILSFKNVLVLETNVWNLFKKIHAKYGPWTQAGYISQCSFLMQITLLDCRRYATAFWPFLYTGSKSPTSRVLTCAIYHFLLGLEKVSDIHIAEICILTFFIDILD